MGGPRCKNRASWRNQVIHSGAGFSHAPGESPTTCSPTSQLHLSQSLVGAMEAPGADMASTDETQPGQCFCPSSPSGDGMPLQRDSLRSLVTVWKYWQNPEPEWAVSHRHFRSVHVIHAAYRWGQVCSYADPSHLNLPSWAGNTLHTQVVATSFTVPNQLLCRMVHKTIFLQSLAIFYFHSLK